MYTFDYRADFIVSDDNNDLSQYTNLLTGLPFEQTKKGDERHSKSGVKLNRKASLSYLKWRLHAEEELSSKQRSLDDVLLDCLRQIEGKPIPIDELRRMGAQLAIEIGLRPHNSYSVLTLTPKLTAALSGNGIHIDLCLVVPPGRLY